MTLKEMQKYYFDQWVVHTGIANGPNPITGDDLFENFNSHYADKVFMTLTAFRRLLGTVVTTKRQNQSTFKTEYLVNIKV